MSKSAQKYVITVLVLAILSVPLFAVASTTFETMTSENSSAFSYVLSSDSDRIEFFSEFAESHTDELIEFDAYISVIDIYEIEKDRFDMLLYAGDYNEEESHIGPNFFFKNLKYADLHLEGVIPEKVTPKLNVHVIAKVLKFDDESALFYIEPMQITFRENSDLNSQTETKQETKTESKTETIGQKNAVASAKSYLSFSAFSKSGLVKQLEFEGYSTSEATYAVEQSGADWNEQALKSAKSYLSFSAFSEKGLIKQLEFEGYSSAEAKQAVERCGADWNEQAVKSAKSYLDFSSFSKKSLIKQLEYEGFTNKQATYGAEQNGY